MRMKLCAIVLAVFLPAILCAEERDYVIGDGDGLNISVWGEPELSQQIMVRPDGKITMPAMGDLVATGNTPEELSKKLEQDLLRFVQVPIVTVTVTGINNSKVYVFGGGPGTGVHNMPGRTTLLKFLTGLGNLKEADLTKSYLMRNKEVIHKDFYDLFIKGDLTKDVEIMPNDIIFMPDNMDSKIYIMGAVGSPGFILYREGLSVLDAILQVGGFTEFARENNVVIVRTRDDTVEKINANLKDVMKEGDFKENIPLEKGDFVVVKESIF
jgi:polysaccharide export outer membrane protein